eukprot:1364172-Rhodomonas_salina.5
MLRPPSPHLPLISSLWLLLPFLPGCFASLSLVTVTILCQHRASPSSSAFDSSSHRVITPRVLLRSSRMGHSTPAIVHSDGTWGGSALTRGSPSPPISLRASLTRLGNGTPGDRAQDRHLHHRKAAWAQGGDSSGRDEAVRCSKNLRQHCEGTERDRVQLSNWTGARPACSDSSIAWHSTLAPTHTSRRRSSGFLWGSAGCVLGVMITLGWLVTRA